MTKNPDEESICSRIERLIIEYEQSSDPDSTEIGRQFAVREEKTLLISSFYLLFSKSNYNK